MTDHIYQGDWIGFGGEREYTPNTLTYLFPDYTGEDIIIAPHTRYELGENGLRDAYGVPVNQTELQSTESVLLFARSVVCTQDIITTWKAKTIVLSWVNVLSLPDRQQALSLWIKDSSETEESI